MKGFVKECGVKRRPHVKGATRRYKWEIQVAQAPRAWRPQWLYANEGLFRKRVALKEARRKSLDPSLDLRVVDVTTGQVIFQREPRTMDDMLKTIRRVPA